MNHPKPAICAYCGCANELTREHLYPRFLYGKVGPHCLGYNEAADKVTQGERTIKDVCANCNNVKLSALDLYGQKYFDLNRVGSTFTEQESVDITYDYDLLLRWVLKISYNSFRTIRSLHNPFASLTRYILDGTPKPKPKFVKLFIELVRDHKLSDIERSNVSEEFQKAGYIPCMILESGRVLDVTDDNCCHCRHFQVNAHRFTIFLFRYTTRHSQSQAIIQQFKEHFPFTTFIDPNLKRIKVSISSRDVLLVHKGQQVHFRQRIIEAQQSTK